MQRHPSRVLFATPLVQVGQFRCPVFHPMFGDSGPTRRHCFVFPRAPVWIQHEGAPAFVADPTVVPLYNPGRPYTRRAIAGASDRTDWFGVSPDLLRDVLEYYDPARLDEGRDLFRFPYGRADATTYLAQREVFDQVRSGEASDGMFVEESVIGILAAVLDATYTQAGMPPENRRHRDIVEQVRAHLARSFAQRETLEDLAAAVSTSAFHLCRLFVRYTGSTLHGYRTELRLRQSIELLRDGEGDILAVALALGYSGHSHFTRAFHRAFGVPPSRVRTLPSRIVVTQRAPFPLRSADDGRNPLLRSLSRRRPAGHAGLGAARDNR